MSDPQYDDREFCDDCGGVTNAGHDEWFEGVCDCPQIEFAQLRRMHACTYHYALGLTAHFRARHYQGLPQPPISKKDKRDARKQASVEIRDGFAVSYSRIPLAKRIPTPQPKLAQAKGQKS